MGSEFPLLLEVLGLQRALCEGDGVNYSTSEVPASSSLADSGSGVLPCALDYF